MLLVAPRRFTEADFKQDRRATSNRKCTPLVEDGLFADEATAMLSTWQRAYFTSPGLRLFYLVPRVWTDHVLPLSISGDPAITRSMIGRVELISDQQRKSLDALARADGIDSRWLDDFRGIRQPGRNFWRGELRLGDLGVKIPPHFQLYLSLGQVSQRLGRIRRAEARPRENEPHAVHQRLPVAPLPIDSGMSRR